MSVQKVNILITLTAFVDPVWSIHFNSWKRLLKYYDYFFFFVKFLTPTPGFSLTPEIPQGVVIQGNNSNPASEKFRRVRNWSITKYKVGGFWLDFLLLYFGARYNQLLSIWSPHSIPGRLFRRSLAVGLVPWIWTWSPASSCSKTTDSAMKIWPVWLRRLPVSSLSSQLPRRTSGMPSQNSASKPQLCT